jgi:transcription elongation GreA/GreB family factor
MDHTALKKSVLKAARTRLEATASELRTRIEELKAVTIGDDNAESASQTESTRGGDVELMNSLGEQYEHILKDLEQLDLIDPAVKLDVVQYGAVVHTDQRNFLIAASLEEFDAGGKRYLGVSTKAPLIQALTGKAVGDRVTFNGTTYTIQDIC